MKINHDKTRIYWYRNARGTDYLSVHFPDGSYTHILESGEEFRCLTAVLDLFGGEDSEAIDGGRAYSLTCEEYRALMG